MKLVAMKKSEKPEKLSRTKAQMNQWGHFRASSAAQRKMEHDSLPVELGQGGVRFERQGGKTFALPCGDGPDNSTVSAVKISHDILSVELSKVYSAVKEHRGKITGAQLRKQFPRSILQGIADQRDWEIWAEGFSPENPQRGRPKGAATTFLERKMPLERATLKSYRSRAKKASKQ
jgi:hypothetical protein